MTSNELEFLSEKFKPSLDECIGQFGQYYVYLDGRFVKGMQAAVPVWDHALLYGDGVFEGIRVNDGKIFKLEEHVNRLYDSAKGLRMTSIPLNKREMSDVIIRTIKINKLKDAHVRPIITRGSGVPGTDPNRSVRSSIIVMAYPFPPVLGSRPARLITSSVRRKSPQAVDSRIKSLNYLDNILARIQANFAGVDDALMLDVNSFVAEATGENIFLVREGTLLTPTTTSSLHGITRATVIELAGRLGHDVRESRITVGELYTADEVFLTGTGAGIVPISEIDGRAIGTVAPGKITAELLESYGRHIRQEHVTDVYP